jgi:hypothetical protein
VRGLIAQPFDWFTISSAKVMTDIYVLISKCEVVHSAVSNSLLLPIIVGTAIRNAHLLPAKLSPTVERKRSNKRSSIQRMNRLFQVQQDAHKTHNHLVVVALLPLLKYTTRITFVSRRLAILHQRHFSLH